MTRKFLLSALLLGTISGVAWAQPDAVQPAQNPVEAAADANTNAEAKKQQQMEKVMRQAQEEAANIMKMPEAQRKAKLQLMQEQGFRATLTRAGFPDKNLQEAILDFIFEQNEARAKTRETGGQLLKATEAKLEVAPDTLPLLENYLSAVETAKLQREEATKALDEEIGFSQKPRLKAILTLYGIIGEAAYYTGDVQLAGQMSLASLYPFLLGNTTPVVPLETEAKPVQ